MTHSKELLVILTQLHRIRDSLLEMDSGNPVRLHDRLIELTEAVTLLTAALHRQSMPEFVLVDKSK